MSTSKAAEILHFLTKYNFSTQVKYDYLLALINVLKQEPTTNQEQDKFQQLANMKRLFDFQLDLFAVTKLGNYWGQDYYKNLQSSLEEPLQERKVYDQHQSIRTFWKAESDGFTNLRTVVCKRLIDILADYKMLIKRGERSIHKSHLACIAQDLESGELSESTFKFIELVDIEGKYFTDNLTKHISHEFADVLC